MKTNKLKNYIKLGIILFSISLLLTNCQNDIDDRNDIQKNEIIIKRVTFEELSSKENIQNSLKSISKKLDFNKVQSANKNINSNDNSFVILTDEILETTKNSLTNYSFRIQTPTDINSEFENFVIQQKDSTHYEFYLYKYELETNSDEDFPYLISRTLINDSQINLENFSDLIKKVQKIDDCYWDISFDSSCGCEHVQLLFCTDGGSSNGTSGNGNSNGDNDNGNNETPHDDVDVNDSGMQGDNDPSDHGSGSSSSSSGNNAVGIIKKPFIPYDQQISNCLGVPMPAQNGSTNTQFNYNDWLNSPETTFLEIKKVATVLNQYGCSNEIREEILEILELSENSPFDLQFPKTINYNDIIHPLPNDTIPGAIKLKCVYKKLTQSPKFKNLFIDVFGENKNINVTFELSSDLPDEINGKTKTISGTTLGGNLNTINFKILMNQNTIDYRSSIDVARTIIHEAIHTFLIMKNIDCDSGATLPYLNNTELEILINEYFNNPQCENNLTQHDFMFEQLLPAIQDILAEIKDVIIPESNQTAVESSNFTDDNLNINENWDWDHFFYYFSMPGLNNTSSFLNEIQNNPTKNFLYEQYKYVGENTFSSNCN